MAIKERKETWNIVETRFHL